MSAEPVAPASFAARLGGYAAVCAQLALALLVVRLFDVADRNHFFVVFAAAVGGFAVHYWLPPRFRAPFFVLLSAGTLFFVLGWPNGAWVLGLGCALIALCHLPLPFPVRVAAVALAGLGLAMARVDYPAAFWPLLGSLFMFRMIAYLYDLRLDPRRGPTWLTAAYFLPLPNVSFLFFPILDPKTLRDTYRPDAPWGVAQEGVGWFVHGLGHLLLYRVVKYYVLPAPDELTRVTDVALFLAANYALYLRVSGHFHMIVGVLHLFGFRLPRTHHHYFLASSFTDIWRRINIYWKDFMTKVFFLPAFFALRGWGNRPAAVAATLWVFLVTWLLHSYQVFWLTGKLPLTLYDAWLWLAVGLLVAWNVQRDLARAARGAARPGPVTVAGAAGRSLQVVGMFALVSVFWSCWNTPEVWKTVPTVRVDAAGVATVAGVLLAAVVVGVFSQLAYARLTGVLPVRVSPRLAAIGYAAALGAFALLPEVSGALGPEARAVVANLRRESATAAEAARAVQGYYEEMTETRVTAGAWLAGLEGNPPPPEPVLYLDMSRPADDLLERELIPGWTGEIHGVRLTVNQLGMRDRTDLTREKPPDTVRLAFVGTSVVMGYGVADDEPFPRLVEEKLNAGRRTGPRCQALDFGTGKSYAIHRGVLIDRKVFGFEPDAIYYVAHQDEFREPLRHLATLVTQRVELPYPELAAIVRTSGASPDDTVLTAEGKLRAFAPQIVLAVYRHVVGECRRRGVLPVWVYLPIPGVVDTPVQAAGYLRVAREAGFEAVDLTGWDDGHRPAEVKLGAGAHPNALGHRLIAEKLVGELKRRPELVPAGLR